MNNTTNPCGLKGFAFLEFSSPERQLLDRQFKQMGFQRTGHHHRHEIYLYKQGTIQFIVNAAPDTQAERHALRHGPGACAMGFKVKDVAAAFDYAIQHGAQEFKDHTHVDHSLPAIEAIGGSVIYFVDTNHHPFEEQWEELKTNTAHETPATGLQEIDHLTHNVFRGNMDKWADFYQSIFNFHQIRYFDIKGQKTGLLSRALASPCGRIKIPLNESKDDHSQIEEFLQAYRGEGIQHIALSTPTIYHTVHKMRQHGVTFLDVPDTYYEAIRDRLPWHQESPNDLKREKILIDGDKTPSGGLLLQIFTKNVFGPVFFEIIQRKGNEGFGEGNFQALFEAIERDQIRRGTL